MFRTERSFGYARLFIYILFILNGCFSGFLSFWQSSALLCWAKFPFFVKEKQCSCDKERGRICIFNMPSWSGFHDSRRVNDYYVVVEFLAFAPLSCDSSAQGGSSDYHIITEAPTCFLLVKSRHFKCKTELSASRTFTFRCKLRFTNQSRFWSVPQ